MSLVQRSPSPHTLLLAPGSPVPRAGSAPLHAATFFHYMNAAHSPIVNHVPAPRTPLSQLQTTPLSLPRTPPQGHGALSSRSQSPFLPPNSPGSSFREVMTTARHPVRGDISGRMTPHSPVTRSGSFGSVSPSPSLLARPTNTDSFTFGMSQSSPQRSPSADSQGAAGAVVQPVKSQLAERPKDGPGSEPPAPIREAPVTSGSPALDAKEAIVPAVEQGGWDWDVGARQLDAPNPPNKEFAADSLLRVTVVTRGNDDKKEGKTEHSSSHQGDLTSRTDISVGVPDLLPLVTIDGNGDDGRDTSPLDILKIPPKSAGASLPQRPDSHAQTGDRLEGAEKHNMAEQKVEIESSASQAEPDIKLDGHMTAGQGAYGMLEAPPGEEVTWRRAATEAYQGRLMHFGSPAFGTKSTAPENASPMNAVVSSSRADDPARVYASPIQNESQLPTNQNQVTVASGWPSENIKPPRSNNFSASQFEEGKSTVHGVKVPAKQETITVWVEDDLGRKHAVVTSPDDDITGLRRKILRLPWMKQVEGAWTVHGANIILTRAAMDKWTRKMVTITLENGDGFEHVPTGSRIQDGTIIQPIYDSDAYEFGAIKEILDIKGMLGVVFRGTGVDKL